MVAVANMAWGVQDLRGVENEAGIVSIALNT